jgi:colanic acid biosynthesis glycosyl transferase WcaI
MRLLIYSINYTPELTGVGKYTGEMAESLAAQGHEVRVVTAPPYYPGWQVAAGYCAWRYQSEDLKGVKVWRCPLWVPGQPSGLKRLLHLATFAISSLPLILWQGVFWQPDVVLVMEPPFFCVVGALMASRLSGAKSWLHVQDFEIDAGFELGLLPSSGLIRSAIVAIERGLMSRFDRVSTISDLMVKRLFAKGVDTSKCVYFPNWVDTNTIYPLPGSNPLREELGLMPDTFVALYAGSMAQKQGLEVLLEAAQLLQADQPQIVFVLCGEGASKARLLKLATGMTNVRFLALQPLERLNGLLNLANIHLLPQLANAADLVMPSKLKGMYASGRPVIATADRGTQIAHVVQGCGIVVPPQDVTALAQAIVYLATHPNECNQLGQAARKFAVAKWNQEKILGQLEQNLVMLCDQVNPETIGVDAAILGRSLEPENSLPTMKTKRR